MCAKWSKKLIDTYKNCSIITLTLNYYYSLLTNHITPTKKKNETKHSYNLYIFFTKFETIFSSNSLMIFSYISIDSSIDYSINIIIEKKKIYRVIFYFYFL